jgi:hypothetical protein
MHSTSLAVERRYQTSNPDRPFFQNHKIFQQIAKYTPLAQDRFTVN